MGLTFSEASIMRKFDCKQFCESVPTYVKIPYSIFLAGFSKYLEYYTCMIHDLSNEI